MAEAGGESRTTTAAADGTGARRPARGPRLPLWLLIVLAVVVAAIAGAGTWLSLQQNQSLRDRAENDLLSISVLKVNQIATWRDERLGDSTSLAEDPTFARLASDWTTSHSAADASAITASLQLRVDAYHYSGAALVDKNGAVLLGVGDVQEPPATEVTEAEETALRERKAVLTDFHVASGSTSIHIDSIAPILVPGSQSEAVAWVLLRADAATYLYPLIRSWPVPSNTAETLLVRRDGDGVLYLNELRYQSDTALKLRASLSNTSLPAVKAVLGEVGIVEGTDYRGVKVLAALKPVPDSPWYVVAKVDAAEALGPVRTRTALVGSFMGLLVVAFLVGTGLMWQRNLRQTYETAYEDSRAHHALLQRFQLLVQEAQDAIVLGDENLRIIDVNDKATEIFGYSREEFLGLHLCDLGAPEDQSLLDERLRLIAGEPQTAREFTALRKDGSRFPVETSDRMFEVDGQRLIQAIMRDTSARKRAEQERLDLERQLQHSQRLESLGVLAGGIAHDFNNILAAILGNADLVLYEMPLSAPGRQGVKEIVTASRRAAELCRQMLAYSGHGQFVVEDIELRVLIDDMLNLLRSAIPKKTLLNLNLAKNLPLVRGDVSQINQVIMNLVINAAEAIGERSGVITISTGFQECSNEYLGSSYPADDLAPGLYVTLEVSDTGVGMDKETRGRLFEPFFTTKFTGRGLGLAAVLGIVRGHKGAVKVYSEVGKGSTFKILLPAAGDGTAVQASNHVDDADWKAKGAVLLADDEETLRTLGKLMLERLGFETVLAADGREALAQYAEHRDRIVLVILDLTMPHMNGEEAFRALREMDPDVRILLSSGYAENDLAARFAGKGPAGFIQKPYTLATLREKMQEALR